MNMDLSTFNMSTVFMLALAIAIAYVGVKFFTKVISKIICFVIGGLLLVWVLENFGINIPIITQLVEYLFGVIIATLSNLQELFLKIK